MGSTNGKSDLVEDFVQSRKDDLIRANVSAVDAAYAVAHQCLQRMMRRKNVIEILEQDVANTSFPETKEERNDAISARKELREEERAMRQDEKLALQSLREALSYQALGPHIEADAEITDPITARVFASKGTAHSRNAQAREVEELKDQIEGVLGR